jgi:hypothetical protein
LAYRRMAAAGVAVVTSSKLGDAQGRWRLVPGGPAVPAEAGVDASTHAVHEIVVRGPAAAAAAASAPSEAVRTMSPAVDVKLEQTNVRGSPDGLAFIMTRADLRYDVAASADESEYRRKEMRLRYSEVKKELLPLDQFSWETLPGSGHTCLAYYPVRRGVAMIDEQNAQTRARLEELRGVAPHAFDALLAALRSWPDDSMAHVLQLTQSVHDSGVVRRPCYRARIRDIDDRTRALFPSAPPPEPSAALP